jgi:hypothetical protein
MESLEEIWLPLTKGVNESDLGFYEISNLGKIRGLDGLIKKQNLDPRTSQGGYFRFRAKGSRKQYSVHRLVALHYVKGYFDGAVVNHIDFNRGNNRCNNLEWCTLSQNSQYSADAGRFKGGIQPGSYSGSKNPRAKLTDAQVKEIRLSSQKNRVLAKKYGVSDAIISGVKLRQTYKDI